nr:MAG TPA: hypothetical protein [Caudoviricetes sp.]
MNWTVLDYYNITSNSFDIMVILISKPIFWGFET